MHGFQSRSYRCVEGLPSESADPSHGPGLGQDQANISVDAQAGPAETGADSSSGLGYLVPELSVPETDEMGQGENWLERVGNPATCPGAGGWNSTILTNWLKQSGWCGGTHST